MPLYGIGPALCYSMALVTAVCIWLAKQVYPELAEGANKTDTPFLVKVSIPDLNIRKGAGWISLDFTSRV